jgi:asparagine synthase (glutamine-hydrolysing)
VCGIAGILRVYDPGEPIPPPLVSIPEGWLDILDDSIKHRGPDGRGRFRDRVIRREDGATVDIALVHRRLSILDHAGGHQPMVSVRKGAGVIAAKRASGGHSSGGGWLLYETPDDPALHAWAERAGAPRTPSATETYVADDDLIAVVFNGCIYNHRELRRELQAAGHVFTSDHSDTEVLVHGWREWGVHALVNARGMFGLAIWDRGRSNLVLLRDFAGEKPLYFSRPILERNSALLFSSAPTHLEQLATIVALDERSAWRSIVLGHIQTLESKGVQADCPKFVESLSPALGVPTLKLNTASISLDFWKSRVATADQSRPRLSLAKWLARGWDQGTSLTRVGEVTPRNIVSAFNDDRVSSGNSIIDPHSETERIPRRRALTPELAEQLLLASVESMIDADVPMGCFLSGGIDSGLIAAMAQRILARRGTRLRTFTMRMPQIRIDESEAAAATARHIDSTHTTLECAPTAAEDLLRLIPQLGVPFGDSSLLPTVWLCRAARSHITVALAGDGGDELFAGYERYRAAMWLDRNARWLSWLPVAMFPHGHQFSKRDRVRRMIHASRYGGYERLLDVFDATDLRGLTGAHTKGTRYKLSYIDPDKRAGSPGWIDFNSYLPQDLLRKTDFASMSVALEVRLPFLSFDVARHALVTPASTLMPHGQRKGLLKRVARKYLPADIVDRPKQGFAIPIGEWFRSDYGGLRQMLLDHLLSPEPFGPDSLGINSMINMNFVKQMLQEHDDAGIASIWPWKGRDHSQRLYMLLVLSIWAKWLGGLGSTPSSMGPRP